MIRTYKESVARFRLAHPEAPVKQVLRATAFAINEVITHDGFNANQRH